MTVAYLDPYKDDPYGKLKGDKSDCWFKVNFDEAKLFAVPDGYIIAGHFTGYAGVVRAFKPAEALNPGLCALPIYSKEYEIREKDADGNWKNVKYQPSIAEEMLCRIITDRKITWNAIEGNIGGEIAFNPDAQLSSLDAPSIKNLLIESTKINSVAPTGKLPEYKLPTGDSQRKGWGGAKSVTPDEKMEFVKKELCHSISASGFTAENSLGVLIQQMILEHQNSESFLDYYFDVLTATAR